MARSEFEYAQMQLKWFYRPSTPVGVNGIFTFGLDEHGQWVPVWTWEFTKLWLEQNAKAQEAYYTAHNWFYRGRQALNVDEEIASLKQKQRELLPISQKTMRRLIKHGCIKRHGEIYIVNFTWRTRPRYLAYGECRRQGLIGNKPVRPENKPSWRDRLEESRRKREEKEAKEANEMFLFQKKLERRVKLVAKKKNRKYNRAILKDCDLRDKDYIAS